MSERKVKRMEAAALKRKTWSVSSARRWCRKYASAHYENFSVVSFFLPAKFRPVYTTLYAFARGADRRADDLHANAEPEQRAQMRLAELAIWRTELDRAFGDQPPTHPAFVALTADAREYGLNREGFDLMLDAFERDQSSQRFGSWQEVLEYTKGSANPVGRWVLAVHGELREETARLSDDVCTGLQLVNFMQDIRSDLLNRGRVYLPQDEMREYGVSEEMLTEIPTPAQVRELLKAEAKRASALLDKSDRLIHLLSDPGLERQIRLFSGGGRLALESIVRADYDVNSEHRRVRKSEKLRLMFQTLARGKRQ